MYRLPNKKTLFLSGICALGAIVCVDLLFSSKVAVEYLYGIEDIHKPTMYSCVDTVSKSGQGFYSPFSTKPVCACISKYVLAEIPAKNHRQFELRFAESMYDNVSNTANHLSIKVEKYISICADKRNHNSRILRLMIERMEPLEDVSDSLQLRGAMGN